MVAADGDRGHRVANRRLAIQTLEDAVAGRHRALQAAEHLGEFADRIGRPGQQAIEQQQPSRSSGRSLMRMPRSDVCALQHQPGPGQQGQADRQYAHHLGQRMRERIVAGDAHGLLVIGLAADVKTFAAPGARW